jgi:hypothetical protein
MPCRADIARERRICLRPAALDEGGRRDVARPKDVEDRLGDVVARRAVGMLDVDRERNAQLAQRSTPVITTPRVKTRWKTM